MRKLYTRLNNRRFESRKPLIRRHRFLESVTGGQYDTIDESDLDIKHFSTTSKLVDRIDFIDAWDMLYDGDEDTANDMYNENLNEIDSWNSHWNGQYFIVLDIDGFCDEPCNDFIDAAYKAFGYRGLSIERAITSVDVYEILDGNFHLFAVHNNGATYSSSIVLTDFDWDHKDTDVICTLPREAYKENNEAANEVVTDYAIEVLQNLAKKVLK